MSKMAVPRCSCNTNSSNEDNCEDDGTESTPAAAGDNDIIEQSDLNADPSDLISDRIDQRSDPNSDQSDQSNEQESDDITDEAGHDPELVRKRTEQ